MGSDQWQFDGDDIQAPADNPGGIEPVGPGSLPPEPGPLRPEGLPDPDPNPPSGDGTGGPLPGPLPRPWRGIN